MKKFPSLLLLAGALLFPSLLSASTFEGKVTMSISTPNHAPMPVNFSVKQGMQRVDIEVTEKKGQTMTVSTIMNLSKQEMTTLIPQQKMYLVHDLSSYQKPTTTNDHVQDDFTFEKTGQTEKIAGYTCTKYVVKSTKDKNTTEIWATDQLGTYMGMGNGGSPMGRRPSTPQAQAWEKALMGKDFFPLRVVSLDKSNKEEFRMEATSVEKASLPDSLFAPPADYKKFEMPNLGEMMRGMIPGR